MKENSFFSKLKSDLPDHFWRLVIFGFIIYSFLATGKVLYDNYQENKNLNLQKKEVADLKEEISDMKLRIAYYKTETFKEKILRSKLRYALPGETVVAVPYDPTEENLVKKDSSPAQLSRPNYVYWRIYFFGR